ncbi:MAG TPA: DNA topoisomerase IV [Cellvibrio sp.]|nr:DNA topoisomerase IV [Cellvibrio sp.]
MSTVQASDIKFSGFISVGGGIVDDDKGIAYNDYSEKDLTLNKNLLGLQAEGKISDELTATAQVIARSSNDYQLNAEWAYLTWQASDNTKIRVGRLRTPFYMYSDSLDVGYSYVWITPPSEVYSVPFNNVDGVDIYTTATLGIFDTSLQAYFGSFEDTLDFQGTDAATKTRNQIGLAATIGKDWWTFRAAYHQSDLTIDVPAFAPLVAGLDFFGGDSSKLITEEDRATFVDFGLNIDTGTFVGAVEHTELTVDDSFIADNIREYVMGGVRMGEFLVHVTAARAKDELPDSDPAAGITPSMFNQPLLDGVAEIRASGVTKRNVVTLGTRWDVTAGTALKLELSSVKLSGHDPELTKAEREQKILAVALHTVF